MNQKTTDTRKIYEADGRFGRATYIAWNFIIFLISFVCLLLLIGVYWQDIYAVFSLDTYDNDDAIIMINKAIEPINAFASLINFVYLYFMFVFSIKRLHDLNRSGWMSLLNMIPLVNLFFAIWLSAAIGTEGRNQFGYPRPTEKWEYFLAWFSIFFMILFGIAFIILISQLFSRFS